MLRSKILETLRAMPEYADIALAASDDEIYPNGLYGFKTIVLPSGCFVLCGAEGSPTSRNKAIEEFESCADYHDDSKDPDILFTDGKSAWDFDIKVCVDDPECETYLVQFCI